jgi:predicted aminopeptidase
VTARFPCWLWLAAALAAVLTGCQSPGYYAQAVRGHCQIWTRQERIEFLLAQPDTPPALAARLRLVRELTAFAARELDLPARGQYETYADTGRRFVVWNVHAAPEFSVEPKAWWYPVVGRLEYRGYFSEAAARRLSRRLERKGFDVCVEGVEAYSTLGWFRDPVLNTFLHHDEADLAEILFHELAHQKLFAPGDTDFNEAFATVAGQEGARRWLRARRSAADLAHYEAGIERERQFVALALRARARLETLFDGAAGHDTAPLRTEKARVMDELRRDYDQLRRGWGASTNDAGWFREPVNNARLNTVDAYHTLAPSFERLLRASNHDLEKFFASARKLARLPRNERHRQLESWTAEAAAGADAGQPPSGAP